MTLCDGDHEWDGGRDPKLTEVVGSGFLGQWKALSNIAVYKKDKDGGIAFSSWDRSGSFHSGVPS